MNFRHKNIRLPAARYRGEYWHFITICCDDRHPIFADPVRACWIIDQLGQQAASHSFAVHAYCVMPDHLHALIMGSDANSNLLVFVKKLKQKTGYDFRKSAHRTLWQKKFYDHILRQDDSVSRVAAYIWMNPVRKEICRDPCEYPHSGSFVLDWKNDRVPNNPWIPPWKSNPPA